MAEANSQGMEVSMNMSSDDFTHLSVDKCMSMSTLSNSVLTKSQFGQVVFHDLCDVYPTDCDIQCRYSLTDSVNPQSGDKIMLFKVGWLSVSEYVTFERARLPSSSEKTTFQVIFPADTLPKDDVDLYQLCYVTSGNVIAGASVPFAFRKPHETELIAVEDPSDPGLVVFRSRYTQLQEDLNKAEQEKESLLDKCVNLESMLLTLKKELEGEKLDKESLSKDVEMLNNKLEIMRKEKSELELKLLNDGPDKTIIVLKENINTLELEKNRFQQLLQEKINEIEVHEATIDCLKQDRKHLDENLREYLSWHELLTSEKASLEDRLKKMAEKQNTTVLEKLELVGELEHLIKNNEDLQKRLVEREKLIASFCSEDFEGNDSTIRRALLRCDEEKGLIEVKLLTLEEEHDKCKEKLDILKDSEQKALAMLEAEINKRTTESCSEKLPSEEMKDDDISGNMKCECGKAIDMKEINEEKTRLNARLNSVLMEKADLRSELIQVKHERDELCKLIRNKTEENSSLQSFINKLEHQQIKRTFQEGEGSTENVENISQLSSLSVKFDEMKTGLNRFSENINVIEKFNSIMTEKLELQEKLEQEKQQKIALQKKIEKLLLEDAQVFKEFQETKEKYESIKREKEKLEKSANGESILLMQKLLDDSDVVKAKLQKDLNQSLKEKCCLESQLMELRKELVGKVSSDAHEMKNEIASLQEKLKNKHCCSEMSQRLLSIGVEYEKLHAALKEHNASAAEELEKSKPDSKVLGASNYSECPLCHIRFSPESFEEFVKHFENHTF